jgi:Flp pilus assembly protein TadD
MKKRRKSEARADLSFAEAMNRGAKLLEQGRPREALPFLYQAASQRPDDVDAAVNLGGAHIMLGRFSRAIAILEEAAEREPENSKVWINLGAAYLGDLETATLEQQADAIAAFERALELDPAAPSVNYNLGLIYRDQDELEIALAHFRRAAAINPLDRDARMLVQRLEELGDQNGDGSFESADDGGGHGR